MVASTQDSLSIPMWEKPTCRMHGGRDDKANFQIPMWIKASCDGNIDDYVGVVPQHQSQTVFRLKAQRLKLASLEEPADASSDESTVAQESPAFSDACENDDAASDLELGAVSDDDSVGAETSSGFESVVDDCNYTYDAATNVCDDVNDATNPRAHAQACTSDTKIVCGTSATQSLVAGLRQARLQAVARRMELTRRSSFAQ